MLQSLNIRNAALIDSLSVEFAEGLSILSGETGAGKSIIIDAIGFAAGGRQGRDFIRTGESLAEVEALFYVNDHVAAEAVEALGVHIDEDGALLLSRTQNAEGRGQARINGRSATVGMLREVCALLLDIHGQHQHQSLLDPAKHITLLDRFGGAELAERKDKLARAYALYRENARRMREAAGGANRDARMELLAFQIAEIEALKLKPGEDADLARGRELLLSAGKRSRMANAALEALSAGMGSDGASALGLLAGALEELESLGELDPAAAEMCAEVGEIHARLEDVSRDFRRYCDGVRYDEDELEGVEARLNDIYSLRKKYGQTADEILAFLDSARGELETMRAGAEAAEALSARKKELEREMLRMAGLISGERGQSAAALKASIEGSLRELGMKDARFETDIQRRREMSVDGYDRVEFLFSANAGEPVKPLAQVASGGEASRVMLALKSVLSELDSIETFIFDEIDAGVSGRAAQMVAEKLSALAARRQILCITHLPQIAAMGDANYLIEKHNENNRAATRMRPIDGDELTQELARLIGGAKITDATLRAAAELREQAHQRKRSGR